MKKYVFHLYKLLLDDNFLSDIKAFRKKWHKSFKANYIDELSENDLFPPVNFNNNEIDYMHPNDAYNDNVILLPEFWEKASQKVGQSNYLEYKEITGEYKGICGYVIDNNVDFLKVYVSKHNTPKELYSEFIDLLIKYNFPDIYAPNLNDYILSNENINNLKTEDYIISQPFYYFMSSLTVFNLDYFLGPKKKEEFNTNINIEDIFNPKDFLLYEINITYYNIIHEINLFNKFVIDKMFELLENDKYSKEDILNFLNSDEISSLFKKEYEVELKNMPDLFLFTGKIQTKKEWDMIYQFLKLNNNINKGINSRIKTLRESYIMYLNKKITKKDYLNLGLDYNVSTSTANRRVNKVKKI